MSLPDIRIQNTGEAQSNVPFTFGQVFKAGDLMQGEGLAGKLSDGSTIALQVDFKASHGDKSVRHAIVSGVLPSLAKGATAKFDLVKAARVSDGFHAWPSVDAKVTLTIAGAVYTASMPQSWNDQGPWLLGNIVDEMSFDAALVDKSGAAHPLLTVKFAARLYHATKAVRVEVIVENNKTWQPISNFTYDVSVEIGGKVAYSKAALTHYHNARWHQYLWTTSSPAINVQHNTAYLIASKAVSNYEQITISTDALAGMGNLLTPNNTGPMKIGTATPDMGSTGGRGDIGPLPDYTVMYLLSQDKRARDVMMANADGSGSWSIHMRDERTGYPVRTDNDANEQLSTHPNLNYKGPLPVPRSVPGASTDSPYSPDIAHLPSLSYVPYLVTGDLYYLEEMQFWAAIAPLGTDPGYNGNGKGLLRFHQLRGQAWALRDLGRVAYITPDDSPMKGYFTKQLDANLDFYNQTYVVGTPNKLGLYDGSGDGAFAVQGSSPWQDGFFTWSFGYLWELSYEKALPILQWKGKYAVGRMTDPGYCWIAAAAYGLKFRDSDTSPIYDTFAALYRANYDGEVITGDDGQRKIMPLPKFIDLPCGGQEMADYLSVVHGYPWPAGRMMGYADSTVGYPANIQPGLAVTAVSGIPNAMEAWKKFDGRALHPNYSTNPQWNIIPRSAEEITPPLYVPPVVVPPVATPAPEAPIVLAPTVPGTWSKIGVENDTITVQKDTIVRYRANDVSIFKTVTGSFKASNDFFGRDPLIGVVKVVEKFTPTVAKPGKLVVSSSAVLKKMTKLLIQVFNPSTRELIRSFDNVTANSKGGFTLEDAALTPKTDCAYTVIDAKGKALVINLTTII